MLKKLNNRVNTHIMNMSDEQFNDFMSYKVLPVVGLILATIIVAIANVNGITLDLP